MIKLVAKDTTRQYELTFLLPESYTSKEVQDKSQEITQTINKLKGSVDAQDEWGRKELEYTIFHHKKPHTVAQFYHWQITLNTQQVAAFKRSLELDTHVIRYLVVMADPVKKDS